MNTSTHHPSSAARFQALDRVASRRTVRYLAWTLALLLVTIVVALIVTPWQQNIAGGGQVIAYNPVERRQVIQAPVTGRIVGWSVVEGDHVEKGDVLVEISDNDAALMDRLAQERTATAGIVTASMQKGNSYREKMARIETTRQRAIEAADSKIMVADDKIKAAENALEAAEAALATANLNYNRQRDLNQRGLSSRRKYELAELKRNQSIASADKARADLSAEQNNRLALLSERAKIEADYQAKIEETRAAVLAAESDAQKGRAELTKVDVSLSRQQAQTVRAPATGTVFRVFARQGGEMLKQGDLIAELVPDSSRDVVELWVDGNDAPLVSPGRKARLQFEGWPALQFAGWPSIAVGTFGGRVLFVDATDNGRGEFRILVESDPDDFPWPEQRFLRQGVKANGWVLLDQVSLGFELWRQFNGFPPATTAPRQPGQPRGAKEGKA